MVESALAISLVGFIIILGVVLAVLSKQKGTPFTVLLLLLGLILGPVTGLFAPLDSPGIMQGIVTIALIIVLFDVGYGLKFQDLIDRFLDSSRLALVGVFFTVFFAALVSRIILGLSWELAALLGVFIASTDLTVIYPAIRTIRISNALKEEVELEATMNSVFAAVAAIILANIIELGSASIGFTTSLLLYNLGGGLLIGLLLGFTLVKIIERTPLQDMPQLLSIGAVLFVYAITELVGASGIVAALMVGMMFGNSQARLPKIIKSFGGELELLLVTFVFVIMGAALDLSVFTVAAAAAVFFVASAFVARFATVKLAARKMDINAQKLLMIAAPRGLVCAVLALSYMYLFPEPSLILGLVFAVIFITTIATFFLPAFVKMAK